ncbi:efflux RND transporter periplasmic adaptor subunit [Paroceanicella profunda]|uniref:Efflux RND transporter periplasmic adaptor subunit n=1 Tax=Paroceanicella profunda TaxID=2579971 RepID=A0A5B8FY64_9RHOB|nr:efflux RND transporter periplasmic adaptor subunit [Paroceanicella profunda]QDL91549.1 efflux RND transporter periplasmic adaptor subunit [Paroceanicella profunda]
MKKATKVVLGGALIAGAAGAAFVVLSPPAHRAAAENDPRLDAPLVRMVAAAPVIGFDRSFTGVIGARVQSALGFRVPGKIVERLVDVGQQVTAGQPLMRIDDTDLRLALTAQRNAVAAAQAVLVQAQADEARYDSLLKKGWVPRQRYEQAKAAADTAAAQLAAAEAEARVTENAATYAVLVADADGTVVDTRGEPGQVVAAGQTVVQIARTGPREAVVALPETIRPEIGSAAEASIYGSDDSRVPAHLRQLSDSADPQTRTFEARYVLDGAAAAAPLGATVTLRITGLGGQPNVQVPLGAVLDDGTRTGVWVLDAASSTVSFRPVTLLRMSSEAVVVAGLTPGDPVVALGAHLLQEGARVRTASGTGGTR